MMMTAAMNPAAATCLDPFSAAEASGLARCVRSLTRGRARLRHPILQGISAEDARAFEETVSAMPGVTGAKVNPRIGSLLVTWNEEETSAEALLAAAAFFLPDLPTEEEAAEDLARSRARQKREASCRSAASAGESASGCALCAVAKKAGGLAERAADAALDAASYVAAPDARRRFAGHDKRIRRTAQNRLMLAGYALSLASLAIKSTRAHLILGAAFTALLAVHLYQHRRVL